MTDQRQPERLFRKLTPKNWCQHDSTPDHIVRIRNGVTTKLDGEDWVTVILESVLSPKVPREVHNLFEVAQGALCYGWFFYPLYTLGSEQLYRVIEAALRHKCAQLHVPRNKKNFGSMIDWLKKSGILTETRFGQWTAARQLRNMSSHTDRQSLYDPTMAVRGVRLAAELINALFEEVEQGETGIDT